jgi:hypothetical protein
MLAAVFAASESFKRLDRNLLVVLQLFGRRSVGVASIEDVVDVGKQSGVDVAIKRSGVDASERQGCLRFVVRAVWVLGPRRCGDSRDRFIERLLERR